MANPYYTDTGAPSTGSPGASAVVRSEFALIQAGFDKLPAAFTTNKAVVGNGSALILSTGSLNLATDLTTAGAAITLTATGATNVTLPTTGTLATLAGVEELTNKTLTASVGKGTWTASGTWTLPALTLGGAITYGGVALTNAVTGTGKMVLDTSPTLAGTITGPSSSTWSAAGFGVGATPNQIAFGTSTVLTVAAKAGNTNAVVEILGRGTNTTLIAFGDHVDTAVVRTGTIAVLTTGIMEFSASTTGLLALDPNTNLGLGTTTFGNGAVNVLGILNGTAPTTSPANTGQIYVETGALKYRGAGGTVTTLGAS